MIEHEEWRDLPGYEGVYKVSNKGQVLRVGGRIMKQRLDRGGYLRVTLCKDAVVKTFLVHRLVALAFVPNPRGVNIINHKDECKTNNCSDNLEWVTSAENNRYGTIRERISATLKKHFEHNINPKAISVICVETQTVYPSIMAAAEALGINFRNISACLRSERNRPTAGGYHWEYANAKEKVK